MYLWEFFTEPLLRGPMIASILIALVTSVIGVALFVQRRSLLAETLSHATYPGVILGAMFALSLQMRGLTMAFVLGGGILSALVGLSLIHWMTKRLFVSTDAAFTLILATFFALGIVLSSYVQFSNPLFFQEIKSYIYGQSATLTDQDIGRYALFALIVLSLLYLFYKEFTLLFFDRNLTQFTLPSASLLSLLLMGLVTACIVISMRSVGVILISGLLIAPALAARQYTHRLPRMFFLAALFGALSAFLGTIGSFYLSQYFHLSLPTGPMIVIVAQLIAFSSLLLAPQTGLMMRYQRICRFQCKCVRENLLKMLWHRQEHIVNFTTLHSQLGGNRLLVYLLLLVCRGKGWVKGYTLTEQGKKVGGHIVRLHRLWELYLVEDLGMHKEHVHKSAEEMEHILTPELARKLTSHLSNPLFDPHNQPIPAHGEVPTYV